MKKNRYNIALIPTEKVNIIIEHASRLSSIADTYLLGTNSFPHITLYQFDTVEEELEKIWKMQSILFPEKQINLRFKEFSYITFDQKIYWISLLPDKQKILTNIHKNIVEILGFESRRYDPHMTLLNTEKANYEMLARDCFKTYKPINDTFLLAIGRSDSVGQLTEVIFS